jgi:hypothetical protein
MEHFNRSKALILEPNSTFCPKNSIEKKQLLLASNIYLISGFILAVPLLIINMFFILFFVFKRKARQSSICIYLFFLALFNLLKIAEFVLTFLIKLQIIELKNGQQIKYEYKSKIYLCNFIYFFDKFSGHCAIYTTLFIQFQKYLLVRCRKQKYSIIIIYNWAFAYMTCLIFFFGFAAVDSFYLYDNFYILLTYCPSTLGFDCVINSRFQILGSFKFDSFVYQHIHVVIYNIIPFIMILIISGKILKELKKLNSKSRKRSLTNFIKQSKKFMEIHLDFGDVDFFSILVPVISVSVTFFTSSLSYLTEWNSRITETNVDKNVFNNSFKNQEKINSNFYTHITSLYIIISLFEFFNFGFVLTYQLYTCELLKRDLKLFVIRDIFRLN